VRHVDGVDLAYVMETVAYWLAVNESGNVNVNESYCHETKKNGGGTICYIYALEGEESENLEV